MSETTFIKFYTTSTGYVNVNVSCIVAYKKSLEDIEIWLSNGARIKVSYSEDKDGFGLLAHALNTRTAGG